MNRFSMSLLSTFLVGALLILPLAGYAGGPYHVDDCSAPTCSDSNNGSLATPWRTINHGAQTAVAGETVYVHAGTYTGNVTVANSGSSSSSRITIAAYPGDEQLAILDQAGISMTGKSYITISGLKITRAPNVAILVRGPSNPADAPAHDIMIEHNYILDSHSSAVGVWGVSWWCSYSPDVRCDPYDYDNLEDINVYANLIVNCNDGGYDECITVANGVVRAKVYYNELYYDANATNSGNVGQNGGEGIDFKDGVTDSWIYNNYIHDFRTAGPNNDRKLPRPGHS